MFPCILYFFIDHKHNNIGPARQQPRDWGSLFNFSEYGRGSGAQLLLISFATTRLHGTCNGSINGMEDGGHTLQPHSLRTGDNVTPPPPPNPNFRVFCLGLGGGTKVFYPPRPDYRRFKIPSFTSPGHNHSPVCAPMATFSFSRVVVWVIRYHIMCDFYLFRALTASSGGGGGPCAPQPHPPGSGTDKKHDVFDEKAWTQHQFYS